MQVVLRCSLIALLIFWIAQFHSIALTHEVVGRTDQNNAEVLGSNHPDELRIAFVTNQQASFWNIAEVGCQDAAEDFGVKVDVRFPSEATATKQKQVVEDLLTSGIQAMAISPIDAVNQKDMLNQWAAKIPLITQDSDAPDSNRLLYIGVDNYQAGRTVGKLIKQAFPNGAKLILCIGRTEQNNAQKRLQGVIDELMDRPDEFSWKNEVGRVAGEKFTVLTTLIDQGAAQVAKQKVEDAINSYPEVEIFVGLFAYNPPAILQALKQANRLGRIKVAGFDEDDLTLQGVKDGHVIGTVVQNPYEYGYQSVRILAEILKGNRDVIPQNKYIDIPARAVTLDGRDVGGVKSELLEDFWADLKQKTGK
jgi:ribose transport system substrate-binding protein